MTPGPPRVGFILLGEDGRILEASDWVEEAGGVPGAQPDTLVISEQRSALRASLDAGRGQGSFGFFPRPDGSVTDTLLSVSRLEGRPMLLLIQGREDETTSKLGQLTESLAEAKRSLEQTNQELIAANEALRSSELYIRKLEGILPMCSHCSKVRTDDDSSWLTVGDYLMEKGAAQVSHGLCPICEEKLLRELESQP